MVNRKAEGCNRGCFSGVMLNISRSNTGHNYRLHQGGIKIEMPLPFQEILDNVEVGKRACEY